MIPHVITILPKKYQDKFYVFKLPDNTMGNVEWPIEANNTMQC